MELVVLHVVVESCNKLIPSLLQLVDDELLVPIIMEIQDGEVQVVILLHVQWHLVLLLMDIFILMIVNFWNVESYIVVKMEQIKHFDVVVRH